MLAGSTVECGRGFAPRLRCRSTVCVRGRVQERFVPSDEGSPTLAALKGGEPKYEVLEKVCGCRAYKLSSLPEQARFFSVSRCRGGG